MSFTVLLFVSLSALACASPQKFYGHDPHDHGVLPYHDNVHHVDHPSYAYEYAVNDGYGNDFRHHETRDGYNTKGSYYVLLPDGRKQIVNYYVDGDSGYVAEVSYEGEAYYGPAEHGKSNVLGHHAVKDHHGYQQKGIGHHGYQQKGIGHHNSNQYGAGRSGYKNHEIGLHGSKHLVSGIHGIGHREAKGVGIVHHGSKGIDIGHHGYKGIGIGHHGSKDIGIGHHSSKGIGIGHHGSKGVGLGHHGYKSAGFGPHGSAAFGVGHHSSKGVGIGHHSVPVYGVGHRGSKGVGIGLHGSAGLGIGLHGTKGFGIGHHASKGVGHHGFSDFGIHDNKHHEIIPIVPNQFGVDQIPSVTHGIIPGGTSHIGAPHTPEVSRPLGFTPSENIYDR